MLTRSAATVVAVSVPVATWLAFVEVGPSSSTDHVSPARNVVGIVISTSVHGISEAVDWVGRPATMTPPVGARPETENPNVASFRPVVDSPKPAASAEATSPSTSPCWAVYECVSAPTVSVQVSPTATEPVRVTSAAVNVAGVVPLPCMTVVDRVILAALLAS